MKSVVLNSVVAASVAAAWMWTSQASGQAISIVVPAKYKNVEGAGSSGGNQSTPVPNGQRVQNITPNSEFDGLAETHRWLTGIRFRPDRLVTFGANSTADTVIRYSTTSRSPKDVSLVFEDNIGPDEMIVFDGPLTLSTENIGPASGPKEFDVIVDFDSPFFYDRSEGKNLVLDWTNGPTTATFGIDGPGNGQGSIWGVGSNVSSEEEVADFRFRGGVILEYVFAQGVVAGDFNLNGLFDAGDIDLLSAAVREGGNDPTYDLNEDTIVNDLDRTVWVHDLRNTWFGDANLDDDFNSRDLVLVLASGAYEADVDSDWAIGDFDGDGRTNSSDLVLALADGGYEQGPRQAAAVPEPSSALFLSLEILALCLYRRVAS